MTPTQIKNELIKIGLDDWMIQVHDDGCSVDYELLEENHSEELADFVDLCPNTPTDKGIYFESPY